MKDRLARKSCESESRTAMCVDGEGREIAQDAGTSGIVTMRVANSHSHSKLQIVGNDTRSRHG